MHEIIEQVVNYIRGVWRYHWHALAVVWIVSLIGWAVVYRLPDVYESSARVYVDTESVLRPLLRGLTIQPNIGQRLELMTRTLLSRPNLEKVMRMTDLDLGITSPEEREALLDRLAKEIKLRTARRQNLYTISYRHHDANTAAEVVRALLTIFVESTLGETREDTGSAQRFLMEQIKAHEQRLFEMENRIKEFKKENMDLIMARGGRSYFERLQAAEAALAQARLELNEAINRRDELRRQIRGEEPVFGIETGARTVLSPTIQLPIDDKIAAFQAQLDELLLKYTERHPEVISLKKTIARLEREREEMLKQIPQGSETEVVSRLEQNQVYQQLKIALGEAEAQAAALEARVEEFEKRVTELKRRIDKALEIETQLMSMNRNYDVTKKNYNALVARLESAKLSEEAEKTGGDIQFKVIDPPRVPVKPSGPNRILLSSLVFVAALGGGVFLALVLSQIRPVIYDRQTLQSISGLPVFGAISILKTAQIRRRRRMDIGGFVTACALLVVFYGGILIQYGTDIDWRDPGSILQIMRAML